MNNFCISAKTVVAFVRFFEGGGGGAIGGWWKANGRRENYARLSIKLYYNYDGAIYVTLAKV